MTRFVFGVTLTPQERALCQASRSRAEPMPDRRIVDHTLTVDLPDGSPCPVRYRRFQVCSHRFEFGQPLKVKEWCSDRLIGDLTAIEQKAQELALSAFRQAMAREQQEMKRKVLPKGSAKPSGEPSLRPETAANCAGHYAVCLRFASGTLAAVGSPSLSADEPIRELQDGCFQHVQLFGAQRLVVGICCRYARRFVEPRFLPIARNVPEPEPIAAADPAVDAGDSTVTPEDRAAGMAHAAPPPPAERSKVRRARSPQTDASIATGTPAPRKQMEAPPTET